MQRLLLLRSHPALRSAWIVWLVMVAASTLTRLVLATLAWQDLDLSPGAVLDILLRGTAADMLFAFACAAPVLFVGALAHRGRAPGRLRRGWRLAVTTGVVAAVGFSAVSEILFWEEFTARFNFIAVDYLIYTNEVIGNIRESYPVGAILAGLGAAGLLIAWLLERRSARLQAAAGHRGWPWPMRLGVAAVAAVSMIGAGRLALAIDASTGNARSLRANTVDQEIARNGGVAFLAALRDNALSFRRFYATVDPARTDELAGPWPRQRHLQKGEARPKHVVVIQVESLSASFLGSFGNPRGLTPNLDALARQGLLFSELYAIGTRTVRGLEALSVGLPPLPGQSVVRRPEGEGVLTFGAVLREQGFETSFLYGGYGYFDNMNAFFGGNGYQVLDRTAIPDERVGFSTIWGVSDEYLFDFALERIDRAVAGGKRQFFHLMTTSNHRPYTYPDGRIDIPSKTGRDGAVKYTDWAIGRFIEQARSRPYFDDTLFVIVADHCASVAGKTRIPPDRYRIPAIFYAPRYLQPAVHDRMASQIDLVPTLLSWLGFDDHGRFFGQDLLSPDAVERAWLGNYQEVGRLTPGALGTRDLVVLAPKRSVSQYRIDADGSARPVPVDPDKAEHAIADYQFADSLLRDGRLRAAPPAGDAAHASLGREAVVR
ncbi:LTA synthase family protein [Burkholderiaceae bacterium FT117]|uniref:LTA synthase family protein n=1 Tax=Zeimonas sediminis TaxID=2944268 RepID=UPI002342EF83|nr:LTA synthase family protein [Zeimonas sediminis]MCM5569326.1 LTA synthase family protein [Zeimonas sediminis]